MQTSKIQRCRACGNSELVSVIDIGEQYLSSVFPDSLDYRYKLKKYPLELVLCVKKSDAECGLLQLAHQLDLSAMYRHYPYTSSSNASMKLILKDVADSGAALGHLRAGDTILDIGCNDGTLISYFSGKGYALKGIDAAQNIEPVFSDPAFSFSRGFFSRKKFQEISRNDARLIFSVAMFYHLDDPVGFSRDAAACLDPGGAWIIQMAYLPAMIKTNMYDNIVHEHNGYYGIQNIEWVLEKAGLEVFDVLVNDVYGGSYRVFSQHRGGAFAKTDRYRKLLDEEKKGNFFEVETYRSFDRRIQKTREDLKGLLAALKKQGKKVWVYGASTKGNTILQYCGIGKDDLTAAADANPFKFGKFIIGADIPIVDEKEMRKLKPDYLLSLPYSFTNAFIEREAELVRGGTRFITPLPEVRILP
jgi:SAM-dependent methyltransferase